MGVPLIWVILLWVVGVLGYLYGPYWRVRKVPGPPTLPLVGHLPLMAKYGTGLFSVLAKRYGPIFRGMRRLLGVILEVLTQLGRAGEFYISDDLYFN